MNRAKGDLGIIGLGNMGANLAAQALRKGFRVIGYDKEPSPKHLLKAGLEVASNIDELPGRLARPRAILLFVPAGSVVDTLLDDLGKVLQQGDIVIDGGNSYWRDSIRRHDRLKARNLYFVDLGTSGGVPGAKDGACFMVGGEQVAVAQIEPILRALAVEGAFVHAGAAGAGHFVKLVHNGIEFGMLQAIGEGIDLLERYPEALPVAEVLRCWTRGSVIRSWLIELMEQAYRDNRGLKSIPGYVEDTGEVNWLIADALRLEVAIPIIAQSVMQLLLSRDQDANWARAIAMMRHRFGDHPYGPDPAVARHRKRGRVGGYDVGNGPSAGER